jgi:hypothetical protein
MEEHEDLQGRLRQIGTHHVDPAVQADHLSRMATIRTRPTIGPKLRVAAAFLAGLLIGGSGLAAAGALPDPVQHVAHRTLDPLGIDVPDPERYHDDKCGDEVKKNHGAYVSDDQQLAKSRCGKPVQAGEPGGAGGDGAKGEKGPCQGPPPWAGDGEDSMTAEEKAAAQAKRTELCGEDDAEARTDASDDDEGSATERATPDDDPNTTTTAAPTTTTTLPPTTTTTSGEGTADPDTGS